MAKVIVWFNPAVRRVHPNGVTSLQIRFDLMSPSSTHLFEAKTAAEIRAEVDRLGALEGSVSASVRLDGPGRKPPGFDALTSDLTYNLEEKMSIS